MRMSHRCTLLIILVALVGMLSYMFTAKGGNHLLLRCANGVCQRDNIKVDAGSYKSLITNEGYEDYPGKSDQKVIPAPDNQSDEQKNPNEQANKPAIHNQTEVDDAESVQLARHDNLKKFCNGKKPYDFHAFHYLIYNDDRKIVYCYVPKVACTQWKRIFMIFDGYKTDNQLSIPQGKVHEGYTYKKLKDVPREEALRRLREYKKFMFVREPFERILSAFRDKLSNYNSYYSSVFGKQIIRTYRKNATAESLKKGNGVKFHEFVNFVVDGNFEEHWQRQTSLCQPCAVDYDVLGHYETLEMDAKYFLKLAGVEDVKFPEVRYSDTSKSLQEYYSKIPKAHIRKLKTVYERDYGAFKMEVPEVMRKFLD